MSHWDSKAGQVIRWPTTPWPNYPGWLKVDCGCSNGLEWGTEHPEDCSGCAGQGTYALHEASGVEAEWPGGPFLGRRTARAAEPEQL